MDAQEEELRLRAQLQALLADPLLADVPANPSLLEVDNLIAVENGTGFRLTLVKFDGTKVGSYPLALPFAALGCVAGRLFMAFGVCSGRLTLPWTNF